MTRRRSPLDTAGSEPGDPGRVDDYIASQPAARAQGLRAIRAAVVAGAPEAIEVITYRMPGLKIDGRFLVSYDAFKAHFSLFPASDAVVAELGDEVAPYLAGKGTIRFPASEPLPLDLVRRIVEIRVREHRAR